MEEYHKINAPFKRHMSGSKKGKLITGDWAVPALEYLADCEWEFTEKIDGTNIRVEIVREQDVTHVEFGGRTDRALIPKQLKAALEQMFPETHNTKRTERGDRIGSWMLDKGLDRVLLFGEGYGPGIQNGGNYRTDPSFILFDVKVNDFWLNRDNVNDVAANLGIDAVPVLGRGTLRDAIDIVSTGITWNDAGAIQRWGSKGLTSRLGKHEAEGIVARPVVTLFDNQGKRVITKIKGVDFK